MRNKDIQSYVRTLSIRRTGIIFINCNAMGIESTEDSNATLDVIVLGMQKDLIS